MATLKRFDTFQTNEKKEIENKPFYKIIDKGKEKTWLDKRFKEGKKTMVTANRAEVDQINPNKTAVKLSNVPKDCIIDKEGNWYVLEPSLGKENIKVEKI